uniref:Lipocalin n=1 Tax=Strongyloides papillosus TaxID=174720 RepID=A0A0N5CFK9_STREA
MLFFRLLLVFLIFKTAATGFFRKKLYRTMVKGNFTCKYRSSGTYKVSIKEGLVFRDKSQTLNRQFMHYKEPFLLDALTYSYTKPSMFIKITHTCNSPYGQCFQIFVKSIDPRFIKRMKQGQRKWRDPYNLGSHDLANLPAMFLNCPYKRRASG